MNLRFPEGTQQLSEPQGLFAGGTYVERWQVRREGGLVGQVLRIEGLASGVTDLIVRVERRDGTSQVEHLLPERPEFTVQAPADTIRCGLVLPGAWRRAHPGRLRPPVVPAGTAADRARRPVIIATVTAFTVAHSITLVAATPGWVHVPGPPVEAIIALSIVFVAAEVVQGLRGKPGLTARAPWVVAFSFGLLHGFGFASALAEVGLPQKAIPVALLMFNVGVELGQLLFVAVVLAARAAVARLPLRWPAWTPYVAPYAIGSVAMLWVFERVGSFWG